MEEREKTDNHIVDLGVGKVIELEPESYHTLRELAAEWDMELPEAFLRMLAWLTADPELIRMERITRELLAADSATDPMTGTTNLN